MAIKGKKKSRGSGARRRPGGAPRPQVYVAPREPWYRTPGGRVAAAVGIVLVLALIGGAVAKVRGDAAERSRQRQAVDDYTEAIRVLQQEIAPAAAGLASAPTAPEGEAFETLAEDAREWADAFEAAVSNTLEVRAPDELVGSLDVFRQAVNLYATAARDYEFAAGLEGRDAERALARAAEVRDRATGVWLAGTTILEAARLEHDLPAAGIPPPADPMSTQPVPVPEAEEPIEGEGGDAPDGSGNESDDGSGSGEDGGGESEGSRGDGGS